MVAGQRKGSAGRSKIDGVIFGIGKYEARLEIRPRQLYTMRKEKRGMLVKERVHSRGKRRYKLLFMALPFMALVLMFNYLPVVGWLYAFFDYIPGVPLLECDFVGTKYFKMLFTDVNTARVLKNTLIFGAIGVLVSPLPMLFAITLNEVKCGPVRRIVQTFTTLPNFISWVIIFSLAFAIFSSDGLMNGILQAFGKEIDPATAYNVMADGDAVYWFQSCLGLWKSLGWSSIIYLAAIAGIDQELYEAASIDGANRFQLMKNITLPALLPTFFIMLMLAISNFLNNGLDQYFVFQNSFNKEHIQVLDLYVYNIGMTGSSYSLATAISMLKSIISVALLSVCNFVSKKTRGESMI